MQGLTRGQLIALATSSLAIAVAAGVWMLGGLNMTGSDDPYHLGVDFAPHTSRALAVEVQRDCNLADSVASVSLHRGGVARRRWHGRMIQYHSPYFLDFTLRHGPDATQTDDLLTCVGQHPQVAADGFPL